MPPISMPALDARLTSNRFKRELPELKPAASPAELDAALAAAKPVIGGRVGIDEAPYIVALASHPNADDAFRAKVASAFGGLPQTDAVKRTNFADFLKAITPVVTPPVTMPPLPPGTTTAPVGTGSAGGSTVIGVQTGAAASVIAAAHVVHNPSPGRVDSDFKFASGALADHYNGVPAEQFGATKIELPGVPPYLVHDMRYALADGTPGMELIPVADKGETIVDKTGATVEGSSVIDKALRQKMGLGPDDKMFAIISYVHPEGHHVTDLKQLGQVDGGFVKTEMGNTHVGAYLGEGRTTNSPGSYHNNTWEVVDGTGYPANVMSVSLEGVAQAELNKNMVAADSVLNKGVLFPNDYKNDIYRTVDLNTTFMFYRDWIRDAPHLKNDNSWKTYCAEHKTIVTNIGLNLPHNEAAFVETFGADGAQLWKDFKAKFKAANGREFTPADETKFEPLWKKEGLKADQIRPWKDLAEYNGYQKARQDASLSSYTGFLPCEPGKGLAWAPETTADLVSDLVETYVPFMKAGAFYQLATLMGFKDTLLERMGFGDEKFLQLTLPVMKKMILAEAKATAPGTSADGWLKKAKATMFQALGAPTDPVAAATVNGLIEMITQGLDRQLPSIVSQPVGDAIKQRMEAALWLRSEVQTDIEKARRAGVADASKVEYYSPPAVFQRVSVGMHESSKFVSLKVLCTAVLGEHVEPK